MARRHVIARQLLRLIRMNKTSANCINLSEANWTLAHSLANTLKDAAEFTSARLTRIPAKVPGTVAQSLRLAEQTESTQFIHSDEYDWWYSGTFDCEKKPNTEYQLLFDGLATLADVWLNGVLILSAKNMFVPEAVSVESYLSRQNELIMCFRSCSEFLAVKRPRPKWKTNLVNHQQLRWLRTSLLGRIPGWCPPIVPIGPWRDIKLQEQQAIHIRSAKINNLLDDHYETTVSFDIDFIQEGGTKLTTQLSIGHHKFDLNIQHSSEKSIRCDAIIKLSRDDCWWPHTHGEPKLMQCTLDLRVENSVQSLDLGLRGFKQLQLNRNNGLVEFIINQQPIFCRGACWTIADIETLTATEENLRTSLLLARFAGMNMLRIGGTMVYESDIFYQLCDELGILIWQDFMFANMDYPVADESFSKNIVREVQAQLKRLSHYACISVYCGSSEIQQQAAMMGQTREHWSNHFFDQELKHYCNELHQGIPYFPSTPCEGALPFAIAEGISHYYGVGAYKRSLQDAVFSQVKFTTETLGFANIPEPKIIDEVLGGSIFTTHSPAWKKAVPRDSSAGWDFEDIRDFYLEHLFQQNPVQLRSHNPQRYLELSRVVTGEVMLRTLANWRAANQPCRGALIWFFKDLIPGAGWGLIDSSNQPKAAYYFVKRASTRLAVYFNDRGLDGLFLTLVNETPKTQTLTLKLQAFKHGNIETLSLEKNITLSPGTIEMSINEWLGYFCDLNYSYGFGQKQQDVICVSIKDSETHQWIHDDYYFVGDYHLPLQTTCEIKTSVHTDENNNSILNITSESFLQFVRLDIATHQCDDNYFHLAPKVTRQVRLNPTSNNKTPIKGYIEAINLVNPIKFSH
jgi:beta-mannosidase